MTKSQNTLERSAEQIIFYDEDCGFCSMAVRFIKKHAHPKAFKYYGLQSDMAYDLLKENFPAYANMDTLVLYDQGNIYIMSDAAVKIAVCFSFPWSMLACLRIVPGPLRDLGYRMVARLRQKSNNTLCNNS